MLLTGTEAGLGDGWVYKVPSAQTHTQVWILALMHLGHGIYNSRVERGSVSRGAGTRRQKDPWSLLVSQATLDSVSDLVLRDKVDRAGEMAHS